MGARVDLNPHQIDAALFALKSPLSRGVLLADEVGLGKTIEAGIILAQKWAENKRRILLILPASLRKQWYTELAEKFYLPSVILEKKGFDSALKRGTTNPFNRPGTILIVSYQFAASKASCLSSIPWDLIVIDEAHRIRNSWKKDNVTGQILRAATEGKRKLLLTATPLQNSMMELFGLLSFIDHRVFGDEASFKLRYLRLAEEGRFEELHQRIAPFCHRTLRRQVVEYIKYTKRLCITQTFEPGEEEQNLYDDISAWLQRPELLALPSGQHQLMTLVLRKLLASSTFAIAGAFDTIIARLEGLKAGIENQAESEELAEFDDELEEWSDEVIPISEIDKVELEKEISELKEFRKRARALRQNAKGLRLLAALDLGFAELVKLGAEQKAIIFTESRKTQEYLLAIFADTPYASDVILFNGSNSDASSKAIYKAWFEKNKGSDIVSGSPSSDMRAALVDKFRESGKIMIATEAAAEGINLQFCSLVINYDLPWNPQRIEQRIGRCHRYGQKFDVVVINFLNVRNHADQRVYELLSEKFRLFSGVFGASDELLGQLGSGLDFERRILEIYQNCRDTNSIDVAFEALRSEFAESIDERMTDTKRRLMENFDDEVRQRLKIQETEVRTLLGAYERSLFYLIRHFASETSTFDENRWTFKYDRERYCFLEGKQTTNRLVRLGMPLALESIEKGKALATPSAKIIFRYNGRNHIGALLELCGKSGFIGASILRTKSEESLEEALLLACTLDDESIVPEETAAKLFQLSASVENANFDSPLELDLQMERLKKESRNKSANQSRNWLEQEIDKLDSWADDLKAGLELRIKEIEGEIRLVKKSKTLAATLEEKLSFEKQYKELERERNALRRRLFDAQDEIDEKRDKIISDIEKRLKAIEESVALFIIQFSVVQVDRDTV